MKKIALLGSTGSIGVSALKVIHANPEKYKIVALAAGRNLDLLSEQIKGFQPIVVSVLEEGLASRLKDRIGSSGGPEVLYGTEGFLHLATLDEVDTVISAMSGAAGLLPTYEAIRAGKDIALANKETMVMAGHLVMEEVERTGVSLIPIDSEHSAILQSLQGHSRDDVRRVILTASGGPFRGLSMEQMKTITPAQALAHPNWNMGPKISIDSATMMNKGLEAIEAKWLFGLDMDQISILIHPQSIVHSMVEYKDGSIIAQLGIPDMLIPISYALSFPNHLENSLPKLQLEQVGILNFEKPDMKTFRCLDLALRAAELGGSMPAVLNGANEIAVESFFQGKMGFLDIPELIEKSMEAHRPYPVDSIEMVMGADRWVRKTAQNLLQELG
jgi:1-deoxy-D-xylulose-5-phosphate reductoisomerase